MNPADIEKGIVFEDYYEMFPKGLQEIHLSSGHVETY